MRNVPASDWMGRDARRALRFPVELGRGLAPGRVSVVRALGTDHAGPGPLVDVLPDGRLRHATVRRCEERLSVVAVCYIRSLVGQVVVDDLASPR